MITREAMLAKLETLKPEDRAWVASLPGKERALVVMMLTAFDAEFTEEGVYATQRLLDQPRRPK